jgi:hypothetical protein
MNRSVKILALAAVCAIHCAQANASNTEIVIGQADYGQGQNGFPFGTLPGYYGYSNTRYQQVYGAESFSVPAQIQELVFYPTSNTAAPILPATFDIFFSVTDSGVNQLSGQAFDNNLGDDTQFFATLLGGFTLAGPELRISGAPFLYDPALGNLLLDIRVSGAPAGHYGPFFAALGPGDVPANSPGRFSRWTDFGIGYDNYGLVTGFRFAVPESGTLALLCLGLIGMGLARRFGAT